MTLGAREVFLPVRKEYSGDKFVIEGNILVSQQNFFSNKLWTTFPNFLKIDPHFFLSLRKFAKMKCSDTRVLVNIFRPVE